jgi:hypothetical protein
MRSKLAFVGLLSLPVLVAGVASADVVTLNPVADNTLYYNETGDLSNGAGIAMFVGMTRQSGGIGGRRALVRYDVASAVPAGATITRVEMTLTMSRGVGGNLNIGMYRLTNSWGESTSRAGDSSGGSGDLSQPGDATWVSRFHSWTNPILWNTPGGDFVSTASATLGVGTTPGRFTWGSSRLASDVQGFLADPASNFGWILYAPNAGAGNAKRFMTREASATERPVLVIEYTIPSPGSFALFSAGLAFMRRRTR